MSDSLYVTNKCPRRPASPRPRRCCCCLLSVGGRVSQNGSLPDKENGADESSFSPPTIPGKLIECPPCKGQEKPSRFWPSGDTRIKNLNKQGKMKRPTLGKGGWGLFPLQVLLYIYMISTAESRDPMRGWRIGEASLPGPTNSSCIEILSANVTSLNKHKKKIIGWEADVKALQETRLGKQAQEIIDSQFNKLDINSIFGAHQAPKVLQKHLECQNKNGD